MDSLNTPRTRNLQHRAEKFYLKLLFGGVGGIALLVVSIWAGTHAFRKWQEHRLVVQAEAFFERGRDALAVTAAYRAYQLNPGDAAACRLLARVSEKSGNISAVEWRRRAYELHPDVLSDALAYVQAALQFSDKERARIILEQIGQRGAASASYHEAVAKLALLNKDNATAQAQFAEAVRLEPQTKSHLLDLAALELQSSDEATRDRARTALRGLLDTPTLRLAATRALLDEAIQRRDLTAVMELNTSLQSSPDASLRDHFLSLTLLRQLDQKAFAAQLTRTEAFAAEEPARIGELIAWMCSNQLALLALDWTKQLPPDVLLQNHIPLAISDSYAALHDWTGLQAWCRKQAWPGYDYLRHAYLTRAARESGDDLEGENEWNLTMKGIGSDGSAMASLARLVTAWGWRKDGETLLWRLAADRQNQPAALSALANYYTEIGDTPDLYRVALRSLEANPQDAKAQNNVAQLSLLLNLDLEHGRSLARRLYDADSHNPIVASTYAFALHTQQLDKQAVKIMEALSPEQLREPGIAAYYGVVLAAAGEIERSREFLKLAETAKLLPEEVTLVAQATALTAAVR